MGARGPSLAPSLVDLLPQKVKFRYLSLSLSLVPLPLHCTGCHFGDGDLREGGFLPPEPSFHLDEKN